MDNQKENNFCRSEPSKIINQQITYEAMRLLLNSIPGNSSK